jgi:hypothetical protein
MNYDSPQFIAAVKKVLRDGLANLTNSLNDLKDSVSVHWQTDEKRYQTKPITVADLRTDVPIRVQAETQRSKPEKVWRCIKGALEAAGIIAVVVYTILAYRQWHEMIFARHQTQSAIAVANRSAKAAEESLAESQDAFRKDQRPFVWINPKKPGLGEKQDAENSGLFLLYDTTTQRLTWTVHFANFGKTPALNVVVDKHVEVGADAFQKVKWHEMPPQSPAVLPSGADFFTTAFSPNTMTNDYAKAESFSDRHVVVFGHLEYSGLDGAEYWSEFCFYRLSSGAVSSCPSHNDMH